MSVGFVSGLKAVWIAGLLMVSVPIAASASYAALSAVGAAMQLSMPSGSQVSPSSERPVESAREPDYSPDYSNVGGVPEPSTLLLIGPLASALLLRRRSRGGPLAADAR